jgi:hypothetical protein
MVCTRCLSAALKIAQDRAETVTVNDLLFGFESGEMPTLNRSDREGMTALMLAAKELHGEQGLDECRRVIRDVAKAREVKISAVMAMPVAKLVSELDVLRAVAV